MFQKGLFKEKQTNKKKPKTQLAKTSTFSFKG